MTVAQLIPVLQMAIGPAVLISGVGYLLMTLTNRLFRVIERGRFLVDQQREGHESLHPHTTEQLNILSQRARLLQRSIVFAVICMLLAVLLIITIFTIALFKIEAVWLVGALFFGSLGFLTLCLIAFLRELNKSLIAFNLEIQK